MSWNLYLIDEHCDQCGRDTTLASWNYTHNTNPMMREAGCGPEDLAGLSAKDAAAKLDACVETMAADPGRFRAMNPANGWGDYDRLLVVLREVVSKLRRAPDSAFVQVCM